MKAWLLVAFGVLLSSAADQECAASVKSTGCKDAACQARITSDWRPFSELIEKIHHDFPKDAASHPFLLWIQNTSIPALVRLKRVLPVLSIFALGFKDFNQLAVKYPDAAARTDKYKKIMNRHVAEDGEHWRMFMIDWKAVGLDKKMSPSKLWHFHYGPHCEVSRRTILHQKAMVLANKDDPALVYCMTIIFELDGNTLFEAWAQASDEFEKDSPILEYLGAKHRARETGRLYTDKGVTTLPENEFGKIVMSPQRWRKCYELASTVHNMNKQRWFEFLKFVETGYKLPDVEPLWGKL